jgi:L1 cell adhesion molecule like protein
MKNENKYEDMIDIMSSLHKYVPSKVKTDPITLNNTTHNVIDEQLYPICFGGDQLSVARYRGSQLIRSNSTTPSNRLEGLIPVAEDWHTAVVLLKVSCSYINNVKIIIIINFVSFLYRLFGSGYMIIQILMLEH